MTVSVRRAGVAVLVAGVAVVSAVGAPAAVAADEGLTVTASSRYVYDADDDVVHATMTMDLRNVSPDRESEGGVYTYYFDAYAVPVPTSSSDVRATSYGAPLGVSVSGTDDPSTSLARISFPNLTYKQTRHIELTFDITGERPRAKDQTRMGPGYATFVAYGPGDEGKNSVEIVAPSAMDFTSTIDGFTPSGSGGTTTYRATENTFEGGLWSVISLRDPEQISERSVSVGDLAFTLESFPDDEKWSTFVSDTVTEGLPVLEELVDNPWPGGLQRIREDAAPSLRGYDGWFDPSGDEIVVGEQLDADLIYHELSHAWVSGESFDERWLYEGLAQAIAERAVDATGATPAEHPTVQRTDADAVALNAWDGDASDRSGDVDGYAYPASYTVMSALLDGLDTEQVGALVGAGIRGERAYDPPGTVTPSAGRTSWSDWLDLVQTRTGNDDAPKLFARWVLTPEQETQLVPRARARKAYAELDAADGTWLPPEGLRDAMTSWDFDRARVVQDAVAGLAPAARSVQDAAERTGLAVPKAVRQSYERASLEDDYAALATSLPQAATAITSVGAARSDAAGLDDPVRGLGARVLGVDDLARHATTLLEAGEIDTARATAERATDRAGWALVVGVVLPLLVLVVFGSLVGAALITVQRRLHHRALAGGSGPTDGEPSDAVAPDATSGEGTSGDAPADGSTPEDPSERAPGRHRVGVEPTS